MNMKASEKFCLKWNDFQKNVSESFTEIREDFCDVTLAGEGNRKIKAHKVILAASSSFFREILKENQHPHPLLYMRGVKGDHLASVVDFMYHGEVNIAQEDLNDFLIVADELKLKGLSGNIAENKEVAKELSNIGPENQRKGPQLHYDQQSENNKQGEHQMTQTEFNETENATVRQSEHKITTTHELLDESIKTMLIHSDGAWSCTECGKKAKGKQQIRYHIEANHIEELPNNCDQCGKCCKTRNSLASHKSLQHRVLQ